MGTSRPHLRRRAVALMAGFAWPLLLAEAQFGPLVDPGSAPQARTQDEFDAYLEVLATEGPDQRLAAAAAFVNGYPRSALEGLVAVQQMEAYRELGDFPGVLDRGGRVLTLLPDNLRALLTLAAAIANQVGDSPDAQRQLEHAEVHARHALDVMHRKQIPRSIPLAEWKRFRAGLASEAHEALGHVATKQDDSERAVREFERAVELNPIAEGRQWFRLGVAYALDGRSSRAITALRQAVELGPPLIRKRASQALESLEQTASQAPEQ